MPKNGMTALTLSGPAEALDRAVETFLMGRAIHPEDASEFLSGVKKLERPTGANPYAGALAAADKLLERAGITAGYAAFEDENYSLSDCESFLSELSSQCETAEAELKTLSQRCGEDGIVLELLGHLKSVEEPLDSLLGLRYTDCHFGRVPAENAAFLQSEADAAPDILALETDKNEQTSWFLVLSVPEACDKAEALLNRAGFAVQELPGNPTPGKTAAELWEALSAVQAENESRRQALQSVQTALLQEKQDELLRRRAYLKYKSSCFAARQYAGLARGRFYLVGWVDSAEADSFAAEFEQNKGFSCVKSSAGPVPEHPAPVKLKKRRFSGIFEVILRMYGLPSEGEIDPRVFLSITYTLFFGIMFGDVGQGACLVLIGWLLWKKTGGGIWRLFSVCGVSSVVFGLIYGSFFGYEELFPWGGFHVLEGGNLMTALLLAVALGVVVLACCMVINIINSLRRRDYRSGLFGPNGVCGMIFYLAVLALVVGLYTKMFTVPKLVTLLCVVLPLALMWFGEPLSLMAAGDKSWKKMSIGSVAITGFFDIFEALLSYLSNTMSFLRVGAFAISHAGMMMVVYLIADVCSGAAGNIAVLVFGNAFVALLEAGLASIQIIRLQFYEMFGRYYSGRGREFHSLTVDFNN